MIISGYVVEKCNHCGYSQKRPSDLKTPLVLHTINGVMNDYRIDNLEVLCYNCYFVLVGNLSIRDLKTKIYDRPEELEDNPKNSILNNEKSMEVLSSMDLMSDEEKIELLKNLKDI
jgi:hypothetical protein